MRKFAKAMMLAANTLGCVAFVSPANAGLVWHTAYATGQCDPLNGCYAPTMFDASLGTLRSVDVNTSTSFSASYRYLNFDDQDASTTFLVSGSWANLDSSGNGSATQIVTMTADSSDFFEVGLDASESHTTTNVDPFIGIGDFNYDPEWNYSVVAIGQTGDAFWDAEPQYHADGTYADVSLIYHYTTGAVPEPVSWALMLVGFGLVGGAMRRHAKRPVSLKSAPKQ